MSTNDASEAVQVALYTRLAGGGLSVPVVDSPVERTAYPYLTIGDSTADRWDQKLELGQRHVVTLHLRMKAGGRRAVKAVQAAIADLLNRQEAALSVSGHSVVLCTVGFTEVFEDPDAVGDHDGPLWHGAQRVEILTQAN